MSIVRFRKLDARFILTFSLYLYRSMIGDIDTEIDKAQDLNSVRADPIPDVRHY